MASCKTGLEDELWVKKSFSFIVGYTILFFFLNSKNHPYPNLMNFSLLPKYLRLLMHIHHAAEVNWYKMQNAFIKKHVSHSHIMTVAWNSRLVVHALNVILEKLLQVQIFMHKVLYNSILTKSKTTQKAFHLHFFVYTNSQTVNRDITCLSIKNYWHSS